LLHVAGGGFGQGAAAAEGSVGVSDPLLLELYGAIPKQLRQEVERHAREARQEHDRRAREARALDPADADLQRASALYVLAMRLIGGRARHEAEEIVTFGAEALQYFQLLQGRPVLPDDEAMIFAALKALVDSHVTDHRYGARRNKRRKRLRAGAPRMRLNDPHYVAAWFIEQRREHWCRRHGERRCPAAEIDAMIDREIANTSEVFGIQLSKPRLVTVLREPKKRRFTEIFYQD
jgi:hypothetical protein